MAPPVQVFSILAIFFVFYVIQPLVMTNMKYAGIPNTDINFSWTTFLFMLPNYYAMVPVGFLPSTSTLADMTLREWRTGCFMAVLDLVNQLMSKTGMMMTGAGVYILINSSGIIWTVLLSAMVLGKRPNVQQCVGIAFVFFGLCMKILDSAQSKKPTDPDAEDNETSDASLELLGIGLVMASSILDGATFVLLEKFQSGQDPIPGPQLSCMQGMVAATGLTIWTLVYTLRGQVWEDLIVEGLSSKCSNKTILELVAENATDRVIEREKCLGDNQRTIIYCLFALLFANMFTSSTVWWLLLNVGAVTFVVVKALKIVLVFSMAHWLNCHKDQNECFSNVRWACAISVVLGVVIYSLAPKKVQAADHLEQEEDHEGAAMDGEAVGLSFAQGGSVARLRNSRVDSGQSFHSRHSGRSFTANTLSFSAGHVEMKSDLARSQL